MSTTTENTDISNNRRLLYNVDQFLPREIPAIIPTINSENVEPKPRRKFFYQISIHSGNQYPDKNIHGRSGIYQGGPQGCETQFYSEFIGQVYTTDFRKRHQSHK